jgi:hypothetical protein
VFCLDPDSVLLRLSGAYQEHIPRPTAKLRVMSVFYFGSVLELIAVLISSL